MNRVDYWPSFVKKMEKDMIWKDTTTWIVNKLHVVGICIVNFKQKWQINLISYNVSDE